MWAPASGFFARALLRAGAAEAATCVDPAYDGDRSEDQSGKASGVLPEQPSADAWTWSSDGRARARGRRRRAAAAIRDRPIAGARFVVSVPACSWLWSGHDDFLEHRRRYTLLQFLSVMLACRPRADPALLLLRAGVSGRRREAARAAPPSDAMARRATFAATPVAEHVSCARYAWQRSGLAAQSGVWVDSVRRGGEASARGGMPVTTPLQPRRHALCWAGRPRMRRWHCTSATRC